MSLFTQLIDHLPDELQDKARTIAHSIDRVPEGIKRTEDTIDGSWFRLCPFTTIHLTWSRLTVGILHGNSEI